MWDTSGKPRCEIGWTWEGRRRARAFVRLEGNLWGLGKTQGNLSVGDCECARAPLGRKGERETWGFKELGKIQENGRT
jgi:hypothetical protein